MSPIAVRNRPGPAARAIALPHVAALAGAVAVVLVVAAWLAPEQSFVDRISVVNPSPYDLVVEARGATGGWILIGAVAHHRTTVVEQVLDRGDRWTFRFRGQGREGGTATALRVDLEQAHWRVTVPAPVGERLTAAGAPLSP